jgi:hypothetical protein
MVEVENPHVYTSPAKYIPIVKAQAAPLSGVAQYNGGGSERLRPYANVGMAGRLQGTPMPLPAHIPDPEPAIISSPQPGPTPGPRPRRAIIPRLETVPPVSSDHAPQPKPAPRPQPSPYQAPQAQPAPGPQPSPRRTPQPRPGLSPLPRPEPAPQAGIWPQEQPQTPVQHSGLTHGARTHTPDRRSSTAPEYQ